VRVSAVVVSHGHARELERSLPALAPQVDELVVKWPKTGETQTFTNVAADRILQVTEGSGSEPAALVEKRYPAPVLAAVMAPPVSAGVQK